MSGGSRRQGHWGGPPRQGGAPLPGWAAARADGVNSCKAAPPSRRQCNWLLETPRHADAASCRGAAYMGGISGKPSFLPCLLIRDLCCSRAQGGGAWGGRREWAASVGWWGYRPLAGRCAPPGA
jgi:hypothetical protein